MASLLPDLSVLATGKKFISLTERETIGAGAAWFFLGGYWVVVMNVMLRIHSDWWDIHVGMSRIPERNSVKNIFVIHISITVGILRMNESFNRKRLERRPRWSSDEYPRWEHSLRWENKSRERQELTRALKENEKAILRWCFRTPSVLFSIKDNSSRISTEEKLFVLCNNYFDSAGSRSQIGRFRERRQ